MSPYRRILVPVDGSSTSKKALASALALAHEGGVRLRIVHSVDELTYLTGYEGSPEIFDVMRASGEKALVEASAMARAAGVDAETKLFDPPTERLGELVAAEAREWKADLIVVGTHGRRGIGRMFLGSGAEEIIRLAPVPVLVVRAEDQDTKAG
jgi:nucleotide-binding universal stress UspA family protein